MPMNALLVLVTAVLFYFIGRYSGREVEVVKEAIKTIQKRQNRVKAGVIDFPTPQDIAFSGSEEEKINEQAKEALRREGLLK